MTTKINNGTDGSGMECYLYCNVSDIVSEHEDCYDSDEEMREGVIEDVRADCEEQGYNEEETADVVSYYETRFF